MDKGKIGMKRKQLYRKVCACKYLSEKKAPATVWTLQKKLKKIRKQHRTLLLDFQNLKDKNHELVNSVALERLEHSKLKDENHGLRTRFHSLVINYNSTKEELIRAHQLITKLEDDISQAFTRVLKFSEGITIAKSRIGEYFSFAQSKKFHKGKEDGDFSRKHSLSPVKDYRCGVPVKHRVGPMIKGYPIIKPKIMLKRISVPVQQELGDLEETDSGDTSNDAPPVPQLTPVLEEEESVGSGPELPVTQTRKTGFRYRLHSIRNDEKNNNRTSNNNTEETTSVIFTCDSVGDNTNNCDKEPVVHLGNMSQMLILGDTSVFEVNGPNSPLHVTENGSEKTREGKESSKEEKRKYNGRELNKVTKNSNSQSRSLKRSCEDPLEGCSWMYNSHSKRKYANRKRHSHPKRKLYFEGRPVYSSDDSLSDEENLHAPNNNKNNNNNNNNVHNSLLCKGNNAVCVTATNGDEGKVGESVLQESFVCPYYDPSNPKHNNDRKLCNSCETCVGLQFTTRPRSKVNKKVENVGHVSLESDNDVEILGFSKKSNSWVCSSDDKSSDMLITSPCKTESLTPEANGILQISKNNTSTSEQYENSVPLKDSPAMPNVVLQRLEPELSLIETISSDVNKSFSCAAQYITDNDSVDLNKNVKLKTSLELNGSVTCVQGNISEESVRKSGRKSSLRKHRRKSSMSKRLTHPNTRSRSRRLSESGSRTSDNESSEESSGIMTSRPRRNVKKVSYKPVSLSKKLRRE